MRQSGHGLPVRGRVRAAGEAAARAGTDHDPAGDGLHRGPATPRAAPRRGGRRVPPATVEQHPGLLETDFGQWEGLTFAEAAARERTKLNHESPGQQGAAARASSEGQAATDAIAIRNPLAGRGAPGRGLLVGQPPQHGAAPARRLLDGRPRRPQTGRRAWFAGPQKRVVGRTRPPLRGR
ncbi:MULTISPECIES: histidine phosphatase family protein [Thermocrispum]|uniref:Histidine phosphatase family protein n=1 Tax=Thermocrispum agreste TaxID=37925 RepID=A0ABD6FDJ0_9PSEU|nr:MULTISPECIES: histidine phosphatase family protein [Thermocrispum]